MKTMILWSVGALALGLAGWALYRRKKPKLSEKQQLLKQLRQGREETALANHRQNCAELFIGLSGGIQSLLGLEVLSFSGDAEFCAYLAMSAENESMQHRLATQKPRQAPEPISPELEAADEETLRERIRLENNRRYDPVVALPWEKLTADLTPCLEGLIRSAKAGEAEACRAALKTLHQILDAYHIRPIWYQDAEVQENADMQWDYTFAPSYPKPALYYQTKEDFIRIGAPGCAGPDAEIR